MALHLLNFEDISESSRGAPLVNVILNRLSLLDLLQVALVAVFIIIFCLFPDLFHSFFSPVESFGTRLASKRRTAVLTVAATVFVLRIGALVFDPVPVPKVHDEFSYLLAGSTFAHGRLANPPHPMWLYFDTIYVNQHPMYVSKYPPAQGAILAVGDILGHPWLGVVLSCAGMCAVFLWALYGWLPARWAFWGTALFSLHVGILTYWMDSYWGGAAAAIGGGLVIGALPRIIRRRRVLDASLLGFGAALLANSRPLEGFVFFVPVATYLLWRLRPTISRTDLVRLAVAPLVIGMICLAFMGFYNFRGTGNPFISPYMVNNRVYLTTPIWPWQAPGKTFRHSSPQLDSFFNGWLRSSWLERRVHNPSSFAEASVLNLARIAYFFLWPELIVMVPFLALAWRGKFRFVLLQLLICICGFALVPWFYPHYAAPLAASLLVATTETLRRVRHCVHNCRPVGVGIIRAITLLAIILAPFHHHSDPHAPPRMDDRARISAQLRALPGSHLVIVRYWASHDASNEWVYNEADIDNSKIVWAREIPDVDTNPLLKYFPRRRVWIVEPDAPAPQLIPYDR